MRVNNTSVDNFASNSTAISTQRPSSQSVLASTNGAPETVGDQASLSGAANLVALAKNAIPASRQAKISSLAAQVRLGNYQGSVDRTGQAMVNELIQTGSSAAHK